MVLIDQEKEKKLGSSISRKLRLRNHMFEIRKNPNSSHSCVILVRVGLMFVLIWIWVV